jgi:hypothetical protein
VAASSNLVTAWDTAQRLERQIATAIAQMDVLVESRDQAALVALRESLWTACTTMRRLRELVAVQDELEIDASESFLRARSAILLSELTVLQSRSGEIGTQAVGVVATVLDRIGRVNAARLRARRAVELSATHDQRDARYAMYRVAMRNTEAAFGALGDDPDILQLLHVAARAPCRRTRLAAHAISIVLGFEGASIGCARADSFGVPSKEGE